MKTYQRPAMIIELKYNKDADMAINQIKEKQYQGALSGYCDRILLENIGNRGRVYVKMSFRTIINEGKKIYAENITCLKFNESK